MYYIRIYVRPTWGNNYTKGYAVYGCESVDTLPNGQKIGLAPYFRVTGQEEGKLIHTQLKEGNHEFNKVRKYIGEVPTEGNSRTAQRRILNDPASVFTLEDVVKMFCGREILIPKQR